MFGNDGCRSSTGPASLGMSGKDGNGLATGSMFGNDGCSGLGTGVMFGADGCRGIDAGAATGAGLRSNGCGRGTGRMSANDG